VARSRGSTRGRGVQIPRRRTGWALGPGGTAPTGITGTSAVVLGAGVTPVALDGITVARIRGDFVAYLRTATSVADGFAGAIGIGLTTEAAFAIGITALETPITDEDWDGWLWHNYFSCKGATAGGAAADSVDVMSSGSGIVRIAVDTKAMRKLDEESVIFAAIDVVEVGVAALEVAFNSRMLVMLP